MTWYSMMIASCIVLNALAAEPIAWKAALEGAKMVISLRLSTAETRFTWVRAPARAVRELSTADIAGERGIVRTVSMMWITPLENMISWTVISIVSLSIEHKSSGENERHTAVVTVLISFNPLITSADFPLSVTPTTCPPVTFVKAWFVNRVGMN